MLAEPEAIGQELQGACQLHCKYLFLINLARGMPCA
jgi:hypothetical protein